MHLLIEKISSLPVEKRALEIVERKGKGHPDSIADGIAENVSRHLCKEYIERFGVVLHHNTDQVEVVGGKSRPAFGGGEVLRPIYILISGRATFEAGDEHIPVHSIALRAAKEYLEKMKHLDVEEHVVIDSRIGEGSVDLRSIYEAGEKAPLANDTSFGTGFAPMTETEGIVFETERLLNSPDFKKRVPAVGEDVKVMGVRKKDEIHLTIAAAIVDSEVQNVQEYIEIKDIIYEEIRDLCGNLTDKRVHIHINTGDDVEKGIYYLTVTGTSAESGDDGSVGRGNRVNGLITPMRTMSMEAAAGKNPVSHVGKIYNILAHLIANSVYELGVAEEVYVHIVSQIGKPINKPFAVGVTLVNGEGGEEVEDAVQSVLEDAENIQKLIIDGKLDLF